MIDVINLTPKDVENCYSCPSLAAIVKGVRISYDGVEWAELRLCYKCAAALRQRLGGHYKNELKHLQGEVYAWHCNNFGDAAPFEMLMGLTYEIGKLGKYELQAMQGLVKVEADHNARIRDALGDAVIYIMQYCSSRGWSLADVLELTWAAVSRRDWKRFKETGIGIKILPPKGDEP